MCDPDQNDTIKTKDNLKCVLQSMGNGDRVCKQFLKDLKYYIYGDIFIQTHSKLTFYFIFKYLKIFFKEVL